MFGSKVTAILLSGSTLLIGGFAFMKGLLPAQQAVFFAIKRKNNYLVYKITVIFMNGKKNSIN